MSIRHSLLAILDQGPCYGFQLRLEFERRTGGTWPLNVGQVYTTLNRLERDGLAATAHTDSAGHVYYAITDAGRRVAREWLASPVERPVAARDELAVKLAIAVTLPGADVPALIATQRRITATDLEAYRKEPPTSVARQLVIDSLVFAAEAELLWLDHCLATVTPEPFAIEAQPPKRGRPVRSGSDQPAATREAVSR